MEEWKEKEERNDYYLYAFDVEEAFHGEWDETLKSTMEERNSGLAYQSANSLAGQSGRYINGLKLAGFVLSAILLSMGVLNFINCMVESVYSRSLISHITFICALPAVCRGRLCGGGFGAAYCLSADESEVKEIKESLIDQLLGKLKLQEKKNTFPVQLSGGEQQRAAILRALLSEPDIVLADEPIGNLDSKNTQVVVGLLQYFSEHMGKTILFVTHNMALTSGCSRVISVKDGRLWAKGIGSKGETGKIGKSRRNACMIMEIISIFLGVLLLGSAGYGHGDGGFDLYQLFDWWHYLIDVPSLIIVLIFTVPVLFKGGAWKDFARAWKLLRQNYTCHLSELRRTLDVVEMMQKQVIYAGAIGMLMSVIIIMGQLSSPERIGSNFAVATLTMLYAVIFEMLLLPLQLEVKRRIINYMGEDTDAESERGAAGTESENITVKEESENATVREESENVTAGKESEHVSTGEEKEKTVIVIQIESGKDVTVKVDEALRKETEETAAGTEEGLI